MAHRKDYYFRQKVTEAELDAGFEGLEQADFNLAVDHDLVGIVVGAGVSQKSGTPNISVDVAGPGVAYSKQGQRISFGPTQNVPVNLDDSAASTAVGSSGNEKIVSVFLEFDRTLSDPRIDGNSVTVYFDRAESFRFSVVQGAEATAGSAVPPALSSSKILLADITRTFGQTQILNGNISTTRRESAYKFTGGAITVDQGTAHDAIGALLTELNLHIGGTAYKHGTDDILGVADAVGDASVSAISLVGQINELLTEIDGRVMVAGDTMTGDLTLPKLFLGNGLIGSEANGLLARLNASHIAAATGERVLLVENANPTSGRAKTRIYISQVANGANLSNYEIVTNAYYDGTNWNQEEAGLASTICRFGLNGIDIFSKNAGASAWADTAWDNEVLDLIIGPTPILQFKDGRLQFEDVTSTSNIGYNVTPLANTLYASTMPKAWGNIGIGSGGTVDNADGFNFNTPSDPGSSSTLSISFKTAMASGEYAGFVHLMTGGLNLHYPITNELAAGFDIQQRVADSGALLGFDSTGGGVDIAFVVFGKQA